MINGLKLSSFNNFCKLSWGEKFWIPDCQIICNRQTLHKISLHSLECYQKIFKLWHQEWRNNIKVLHTPASWSKTSKTMMGGLTANSVTSPHNSISLKIMVISHVGLRVTHTTYVSCDLYVTTQRQNASEDKERQGIRNKEREDSWFSVHRTYQHFPYARKFNLETKSRHLTTPRPFITCVKLRVFI